MNLVVTLKSSTMICEKINSIIKDVYDWMTCQYFKSSQIIHVKPTPSYGLD